MQKSLFAFLREGTDARKRGRKFFESLALGNDVIVQAAAPAVFSGCLGLAKGNIVEDRPLFSWGMAAKASASMLPATKEQARDIPSLLTLELNLPHLQHRIEVDCRKFAACLNSAKRAQHRVG